MKETIKKLLARAVFAPSGENSQPWRFKLQGDKLYIYNLPHRDNPVYNYRQRGSYFAHGALIQNILLLAPEYGLRVEPILFPDSNNDELVAKLAIFTLGFKQADPLTDFIEKRATNRKPYDNKLLTEEESKIISAVGEKFTDLEFKIIIEEEEKKKIGHLASTCDRLMLEHKPLHNSIFANICWTEKEEKNKRTGLYLKAMALKPPQEIVFRLLRYWPIANLFKKIGFPKVVAKENAKLYSTGSIFLAVVVRPEKEIFVHAGQAIQLLWLGLTRKGISAHPLAALAYLAAHVNDEVVNTFGIEHVKEIKKNYSQLEEIVGIKTGKTLAMMLRIGYGGEAPATSSRLEPDIEFIES